MATVEEAIQWLDHECVRSLTILATDGTTARLDAVVVLGSRLTAIESKSGTGERFMARPWTKNGRSPAAAKASLSTHLAGRHRSRPPNWVGDRRPSRSISLPDKRQDGISRCRRHRLARTWGGIGGTIDPATLAAIGGCKTELNPDLARRHYQAVSRLKQQPTEYRVHVRGQGAALSSFHAAASSASVTSTASISIVLPPVPSLPFTSSSSA